MTGEVVSDTTIFETLDNLGYLTQEKEYDVGRAKRELQRYTKATNKEFK